VSGAGAVRDLSWRQFVVALRAHRLKLMDGGIDVEVAPGILAKRTRGGLTYRGQLTYLLQAKERCERLAAAEEV
jgi:hypothetical protein